MNRKYIKNEQGFFLAKFKLKKEKRTLERQRLAIKETGTTSVSDLAFLLLIFFILASSFLIQSGINLTLPAPDEETYSIENSENINIEVLETNYQVQSNTLSEQEFQEFLKLRMKNNSKIIAFVQINENIEYNRLVKTISLLKESGIKQIGLENLQ
ncbi:MAG: biopolymer transporter ExbD [Spirochaetia bacterium]|nr:biopolymer transporter ExbD [Spirochaetia bacterium]